MAEIVSISDTNSNLQHVVDYIDTLKVARATVSAALVPFVATGPDKLCPIVLQMSLIGFIRYLTNIYIQVLKTGYTPNKWKEMGVILFPKCKKKYSGYSGYSLWITFKVYKRSRTSLCYAADMVLYTSEFNHNIFYVFFILSPVPEGIWEFIIWALRPNTSTQQTYKLIQRMRCIVLGRTPGLRPLVVPPTKR